MKKLIRMLSALAVIATVAGCADTNECKHKKHHDNYAEMSNKCDGHNCKHKMHKQHKNKIHTKMYTRNNHNEATEIGYVKFYDVADGVKMVVNVDKLRNDIDYTTKIYQCKDAKCMNPDTCCMETTMSLEMPLTRQNKKNPVLQETYFIQNVTTDQLHGATIFFERGPGYRAAWGFLD